MAKTPEEKHEWFEAILKERERRKGGCMNWPLLHFCEDSTLARKQTMGRNYKKVKRCVMFTWILQVR